MSEEQITTYAEWRATSQCCHHCPTVQATKEATADDKESDDV